MRRLRGAAFKLLFARRDASTWCEHTLKSFKSSLVIPCPMGPSTFLRNHRPVIAALLACRADASGTVFANCFCFWFVMLLDSMLPCLRPYHRHIQNSTFERRGSRSFWVETLDWLRRIPRQPMGSLPLQSRANTAQLKPRKTFWPRGRT